MSLAGAAASRNQQPLFKANNAKLVHENLAREIPPHLQAAVSNYRVATDARAFPLGGGPTDRVRETAPPCSPQSVGVPSNTSDAFYAALLAMSLTSNDANDDANDALRFPLRPPTFSGSHTRLCDPSGPSLTKRWDYCLPIATSLHSSPPECVRADRSRLLDALSATDAAPQPTPAPLCHTSVLHLLLEDVYAALREQGARPALLFGSMLGAVRDRSIIPWTRDVDLGYQSRAFRVPQAAEALHARGYHVFKADVWRVCVSPTHPLASLLYDPEADARQRRRRRHDSYVDLYAMQETTGGAFMVEKTREPRRAIPKASMVPYSRVSVFGSTFDTLADPRGFLESEYGAAFMLPDTQQE